MPAGTKTGGETDSPEASVERVTQATARPSPGAEYDYEATEHVMGDYAAVGEGGRRDYAAMKVERALEALAELMPGSLVLEVGCGAGATTRAMVAARPDLVIHACDLSRTAIRTARAMGGRNPICSGLGNRPPLPGRELSGGRLL